MIRFEQLTKRYGKQLALDKINLTIKSHELFVLVGPSGSGKTTLLKMVNRLNTPTTGRVWLDEQDVTKITDVQTLRQQIGYVLQSGALFPNMTVGENAAIQMVAQGLPAPECRQRVAALLEQVGLNPDQFMERMPHELSGGEAQRVGIVRALAPQPKIILMDEPFSALDPLSRQQLQDLLRQLHTKFQTTIIFVTHDMDEALKLADRLAVVHAGHLQQVGTPAEILATPANDFVASFFAQAHSPQHYLQEVLRAGYGQKTNYPGAKILPPTATLSDWSALLVKDPQQVVQVENKQLTARDLWRYLASLAEDQN
ncbi:ABC transporter ATP-binding protein [Lactobacillus sp. DCY120]|uniref:ABC-type quaternary amine transporter n=1 Tax=Bombilactobacillus apium TaxID=2675299 RepID=A0A850R293_9LACO|nr:ABC transporter ATP-binding protein [Bombilactobacillus apium]NVY96141.1 ABC transporter ATP-binding protein [Bombilactobacillus apium]